MGQKVKIIQQLLECPTNQLFPFENRTTVALRSSRLVALEAQDISFILLNSPTFRIFMNIQHVTVTF